MASFTDQITQFNPYVQQLPADEMVKVGMYKQAQYDQGVQKIQGYIDNIAGMNVTRDVDKQYLQSKLNQLGSKLKTVAAGDFSNQQLVNSVGGMATQIIKDPFVSAAVYSSTNDDAQLKRIEEDERSGKLTPQARYFYDLKRSAYLNNPNLKGPDGKPIKFGGQYIRSWDLDKNIIDAVDAVGDRKWSAKQIFKTDPVTGKILYNTETIRNPKTGKLEQVAGTPILSEYATQQIKEGKFSENVSAAIDGVLSRPEAQQELMMRGVYTYRGYDDINDFVAEYEREKNRGVSLLESKKLELMNKALLETDPDKKEQLQALINSTEGEISTLKNYEDSRIKQAVESRDLDAYKAMVYTQRQKNNWMNAYVTESNTVDYVESAPYQAYRQKIKDERDWWKDQQTVSQGWSKIQIERDTLTQKQLEWQYDPKNPLAPINQPMPYEKGAAPGELYSGWIEKGIATEDSYNASKRQFVIDYMKTLNYANGKTISDEQITRDAYKYEKDRPGFFDRQFELAKAAVQKNPTNPAFSNLITSLPGLNSLEKKVENYAREVEEVNNDPEVLTALGGEKIADIEKKFKPVTIKSQAGWSAAAGFGGREITLTPKDQLNIAIALSTTKGSPRNVRAEQELKESTGMTSFNLAPMIGQISEKRGFVGSVLFDPLAIGERRSPEHIAAANNIAKYIKVMSSNIVDAKEKVLQRKMKGDSPVAFEIFPPNAKEPEKDAVIERLKTVLADKGVADSDVEKFAEFYAGKNKDQYKVNIGVNRGGAFGGEPKASLDLYGKDGLEKSIEISQRDASYIRGTTLNIPAPVSDVVRRVQWNERTNSTNSITSDPNNPNAYKGAYYQSDDFYSLNRPNIMGADVKINNLGQPNVYFYVKDARGNVKGIPFKTASTDILPATFTSIDAAEAFIKGIRRPNEIDNILKNANIK